MKKSLFIVTALGICFAAQQGAFAADSADAEAVYGTPVVDGTLDDVWSQAQEYRTEVMIEDENGAYCDFRLLWDENHVYVFAKVYDDLISTSSSEAHMQDSIEFFLDENNSKKEYYERDDAQYRISCENNMSYGEGADRNGFSAVSVYTDYGYNVEAAIPIKTIVGKTGALMGFEIQVNDDGNGDGERSSVAKFRDDTDMSYCNTAGFGTIQLVNGSDEPFTDVSGTDGINDSIYKLYKLGVINGYGDGTFMPNSAITREEFACMFVKCFGLESDGAEVSFDDVDKNAWYAEYVAVMAEKGYAEGIGDNKFGVGDNITSGEVKAMTERFLTDSGVDVPDIDSGENDASRAECAEALYDAYESICTPKQVVYEKREDYSAELADAGGAKEPGMANPLITHKFGADPFAMEYNGRVYIYMTSDAYEYDESGNIIENDYSEINTISVISSADLVNWTDHGEIAVGGKGNDEGAAKWAKNSWAPSAAHKTINGKEKFFLYFADNGSGIGVLEADSPTGPFYDPIDKPLINWETPGADGVVWMFDPAVLVDDDGQAYLYFGGGIPTVDGVEQTDHPKTARVIKLGDDMISTVGEAVEIDAPALFEDSGIHKYNGKYYYSYCSNFSGDHEGGKYPYGTILYMTSDDPMGPFEYKGMVLDSISSLFGTGGNNHHAIFEFGGKWYCTYHTQTVGSYLGYTKGYRSTHINELTYNENGDIEPVKADYQGVDAIASLDPFVKTEAETFAWRSGVSVKQADDKRVVCDINNGDWLAVGNVKFDKGTEKVIINAQSVEGGTIEIRLGSPEGQLAGTVDINGDSAEYQGGISIEPGTYDVYFVFKGTPNKELITFDSWVFE